MYKFELIERQIFFEIFLQSTLSDDAKPQNSATSSNFNKTSLQETFPWLNWKDFINWNLKNTTLNDNDTITVDVNYLNNLKELLDPKRTPKRTIANYIGMRLVKFSSNLLNEQLNERFDQYQGKRNGREQSDSRSVACTKATMKLYV